MTEFATSSGILELCWRYLVLGVLQGITEFLPISSTAHLKVFPTLIAGWGDPGVSVTAALQLGSILAVIAYFRRDLIDISQSFAFALKHRQWNEPNARLSLAIIFGTAPILLVGMIVKFFWPGYETSFLRSIPSIAFVSILMALLLGLAERYGNRCKTIKGVRAKDGFVIGLAQVLAIIPGVSRSGISLTAGLLDGWKRSEAARFSFLLGIPAISLAGLVELKDLFITETIFEIIPIFIGIVSAAVVSWLSIDWLLKHLQRNSTKVFIFYRLVFGMLLLAWWSASLSK